MAIHQGVKSRAKIRIPGKGIRTGDIIGDEYVVVYVDVPRIDSTNEELVELLGRLQKIIYDKELPVRE